MSHYDMSHRIRLTKGPTDMMDPNRALCKVFKGHRQTFAQFARDSKFAIANGQRRVKPNPFYVESSKATGKPLHTNVDASIKFTLPLARACQSRVNSPGPLAKACGIHGGVVQSPQRPQANLCTTYLSSTRRSGEIGGW